jgi:hypothetical protein
MQLKEYVSIIFNDNVLDVFKHGVHVISQPFNSETGNPFVDQTEAEVWLIAHYPDLFTPS